MACVSQPLRVFIGEDKTYLVTMVDDDLEPFDITGYSFEWEVKTGTGVEDPATIAKSVGAGITLLPQTGDTLGQLEIALDSADTAVLAARVYSHDLVAIDPLGKRTVVIVPSAFDLMAGVNTP